MGNASTQGKREFSKNYKDHEPTQEELFEQFEDYGYAWVENDEIYADDNMFFTVEMSDD